MNNPIKYTYIGTKSVFDIYLMARSLLEKKLQRPFMGHEKKQLLELYVLSSGGFFFSVRELRVEVPTK